MGSKVNKKGPAKRKLLHPLDETKESISPGKSEFAPIIMEKTISMEEEDMSVVEGDHEAAEQEGEVADVDRTDEKIEVESAAEADGESSEETTEAETEEGETRETDNKKGGVEVAEAGEAKIDESGKEKGEAEKGEAEKGEAEKGEAEKGEAEKGEAEKGEAEKGEAEKGEAEKGEAKKGVTDKGEAEKGLTDKVEAEKGNPDERGNEGEEPDECRKKPEKPLSHSSSGELEFPEISIRKLYGPPRKRTRREKVRVYLTAVVVAVLVGLSIFSYIRFTAPVTGFDSDGDGMPDDWENRYGLDPDDGSDAKIDSDGDGLTNLEEYRYNISASVKGTWEGGTDPRNPDSDLDKMMDGWEVDHNLNPQNSSDKRLDPDNDGVVFTVNNVTLDVDFFNQKEYQAQTDPNDPDSDGDGMLDGWEDFFNLFPLSPIDAEKDNDGDGLLNSWEFLNGTNPSNNDTDSDGLEDLIELTTYNTDPLLRDTDQDGMPDGWEVGYGLDPLDGNDAYMDGDDDELANWREYYHNTDPYNHDTDSDKMPDGWEVEKGWDPINGTMEIDPTYPDGKDDPDKDILSNFEEFRKFSDPLDYDTDDDGLNDGLEAVIGFPGKLVNGVFHIDDQSAVYFTDPISKDTDNDGIDDLEETRGGTNASNTDSDEDGLDDMEEVYGVWMEDFGLVHPNPSNEDTDFDGLTDAEEVYSTYGYITHPNLPDTDFDQLMDGQEVLTDFFPYRDDRNDGKIDSSDPRNVDTDGDGMFDGWEVDFGMTRVIRNDTGPNFILDYTAEIGLSTWFDKDYVNLKYNWNGSSWEDFLDRNGDGLIDPELPPMFVINPVLSNDRLYDPDNDGLYNYVEHDRFKEITGLDNSTDPLEVDTDGDGMPDGWELDYLSYFPDLGIWGPNPLRWDSWEDPDEDGCHYEIDGEMYYHPFVNIEEYWWSNFYSNHCYPNSSDVDNDGKLDGEEIWKHSYEGGITEGDGLANGWECLFGAYNLYIFGPEDYIPPNIMPLHFNPFTSDSNGDGILDRDADPDGDNSSNLEEFLRKTDPTDPLSFPSRASGGDDEYHQIGLSNPGSKLGKIGRINTEGLGSLVILCGIVILIVRKRFSS